MKTIRKPALLAASLLLWGLLARAQAPLAQPLADFDKLVRSEDARQVGDHHENDTKTCSIGGFPASLGAACEGPGPFGSAAGGLRQAGFTTENQQRGGRAHSRRRYRGHSLCQDQVRAWWRSGDDWLWRRHGRED